MCKISFSFPAIQKKLHCLAWLANLGHSSSLPTFANKLIILNRTDPTHRDFQVGIIHSSGDYEMTCNRQKCLNIHRGRIAFVVNCSAYINLSLILII